MPVKRVALATAVDVMMGECDSPPLSLIAFIGWASAKLDLIDPEYRESATINFYVSEAGYEEPPEVAICIQYEAPESDEDYERRQREEAAAKERDRHSERFRLIELMNKYPEITERFRPREISPGHFRPVSGAIFLDN